MSRAAVIRERTNERANTCARTRCWACCVRLGLVAQYWRLSSESFGPQVILADAAAAEHETDRAESFATTGLFRPAFIRIRINSSSSDRGGLNLTDHLRRQLNQNGIDFRSFLGARKRSFLTNNERRLLSNTQQTAE